MAGDNGRSRWTVKRVETLRNMILEGCSSARIGEALGVSRDAVIGKAYRMWDGFAALRGAAAPAERISFANLPVSPEEAERQRLRDEDDAKYQAFAEREPGDKTCSYTGCKMARQANRFQLCAVHDQERIRTRVAA